MKEMKEMKEMKRNEGNEEDTDAAGGALRHHSTRCLWR